MDNLPYEVQYIFYQYLDIWDFSIMYNGLIDTTAIGKFLSYDLDENGWEIISIYPGLNEPFIEKFKHKVNWRRICDFHQLSEVKQNIY